MCRMEAEESAAGASGAPCFARNCASLGMAELSLNQDALRVEIIV